VEAVDEAEGAMDEVEAADPATGGTASNEGAHIHDDAAASDASASTPTQRAGGEETEGAKDGVEDPTAQLLMWFLTDASVGDGGNAMLRPYPASTVAAAAAEAGIADVSADAAASPVADTNASAADAGPSGPSTPEAPDERSTIDTAADSERFSSDRGGDADEEDADVIDKGSSSCSSRPSNSTAQVSGVGMLSIDEDTALSAVAAAPGPSMAEPSLLEESTFSRLGTASNLNADLSQLRRLSMSPPSFKELHRWGAPGLLDVMIHRLSHIPDELPLEDVSPAEEPLISELRKRLLAALKYSSPPAGWRSQHFTRRRLLAYIRSRNGDLDKALERAVECVQYLDGAVELARKYEAAPANFRKLADTHTHGGQYGRDKRGASVGYMQFTKNDHPGLANQTSFDFFVAFHWYETIFFWDTLNTESKAVAKALNGRLLVVDVSGISLGKIKSAMSLGQKQQAQWPSKEHPMPEGYNRTIVCNVPWVAAQFWGTAKRFFPKRDTDRVRLFTTGESAAFQKELLKWVEIDQVPPEFGGTSTEPWAYGDASYCPSLHWKDNPLDELTESKLKRASIRATEVAERSVSKTKEVASAAGHKAKEVASAAGHKTKEVASAAGHKTKEAASAAGHKAKEAASAAGHKTKEAASAAGHKTKEAASAAGHKAKEAAGKTKEAAESAGRKTKEVAGRASQYAKRYSHAVIDLRTSGDRSSISTKEA